MENKAKEGSINNIETYYVDALSLFILETFSQNNKKKNGDNKTL